MTTDEWRKIQTKHTHVTPDERMNENKLKVHESETKDNNNPLMTIRPL